MLTVMELRSSRAAKVAGEPFTIGDWTVDPASLHIDNQKRSVKIEPKAMAVFDYLACRPGAVVSRRELEDEVWAGTIVGYDALGNAIIKLRKALGDKARKPRFIETIAKSGYRLIAEVGFEDTAKTEPSVASAIATESTTDTSYRWQPLAASVLILLLVVGGTLWWQLRPPPVETASPQKMAFPLPETPSIAVLPFTDMINDAEQAYFADGMTEDLITDISKLSGLFVIARNSVFNYKGKTVKIKQVAEELGVRYIMEGSVRRVGDQVRINAQLIDATTGGHVWAERYDGSLEDVFSMQDRITKSIVSALSLTLVEQDQGSVTRGETSIPEAYDAFLQGWQRYRLGTPEDLAKAITYFEQAIELDPDYARAHSALAAVYWNIVENGWWNRSLGLYGSLAIEKSRISLARAMEHPSALTHQIASERAAYFQRRPDRALAEAERAFALDANDPASHLAMANALIKAGWPAEAIISVRTAMRLDPHFPASYLTRLGQAQFAAGDYKDAVKSLVKAANGNPDDDWNYVYLAAAYGRLEDAQRAKQALEKANRLRANAGWGVLTTQNISERNYSTKGRNYFKWVGDFKSLRAGLVKAGVTSEANWWGLIREETSGIQVEGATTIDAETAKTLHEHGIPFVDVAILWVQGRIPGAIFLSVWTGDYNDARLEAIVDKDQEIVIYSGKDKDTKLAPRATAQAVSWGFKNVYYFRDGLDGWKEAGYPVETGKR